MRRVRGLGWCCCLWLAFACLADDRPPVMLANVYDAGADIDLSDYWVSEKLDGVRGYWDGHELLTRTGNVIRTPAWFTASWPDVPLDGELWAGRGRFEHASSTVRTETPDDGAWRQMRFMVFDLPAHGGAFTERVAALNALLGRLAVPWLQAVMQFQVADRGALEAKLEKVVAAGGEGLMLHRGSSLYRAERSDDLLKYKLYQDAEARVVGHLPGKGKYERMLGALLVERPDGLRFRIGTGFTDEQRLNPPPVGSCVTYAYNGFTASGIPRFARFVRLRDDPVADDARRCAPWIVQKSPDRIASHGGVETAPPRGLL
jgi:DNA ligase 1